MICSLKPVTVNVNGTENPDVCKESMFSVTHLSYLEEFQFLLAIRYSPLLDNAICQSHMLTRTRILSHFEPVLLTVSIMCL